jgi:hypothetical protein
MKLKLTNKQNKIIKIFLLEISPYSIENIIKNIENIIKNDNTIVNKNYQVGYLNIDSDLQIKLYIDWIIPKEEKDFYCSSESDKDSFDGYLEKLNCYYLKFLIILKGKK